MCDMARPGTSKRGISVGGQMLSLSMLRGESGVMKGGTPSKGIGAFSGAKLNKNSAKK